MNTRKGKLYGTLVRNGEKDFIQGHDIIRFGAEDLHLKGVEERIYRCKFFK